MLLIQTQTKLAICDVLATLYNRLGYLSPVTNPRDPRGGVDPRDVRRCNLSRVSIPASRLAVSKDIIANASEEIREIRNMESRVFL